MLFFRTRFEVPGTCLCLALVLLVPCGRAEQGRSTTTPTAHNQLDIPHPPVSQNSTALVAMAADRMPQQQQQAASAAAAAAASNSSNSLHREMVSRNEPEKQPTPGAGQHRQSMLVEDCLQQAVNPCPTTILPD